MNVLFVCTANIQRSLTAEHLFKKNYPLYNFKSAGVSAKECKRNGSTLCTEQLLEWADIVFAFEDMHIERIEQHTKNKFTDKLVNLRIDDKYQYNSVELIKLLQERVVRFLP